MTQELAWLYSAVVRSVLLDQVADWIIFFVQAKCPPHHPTIRAAIP